MRGNTALLFLIAALLAGAPQRSPAQAEYDDILRFVDGSQLHGGLKQMDATAGLGWATPAASNQINFRPAHLDSINFAHSDSVTVTANSRLHFANGDELLGTVSSLDGEHLGFSTWFGPSLQVPRASVQSITFLPSNYTVLYEGPGGTNGWIIGNHNPESWTFRDGIFTSGSPGTLGRDFGLSESATIEFDLAWSDMFALYVNIYSDPVEQSLGSFYVVELTRGSVNLRHTQASGTMPVKPMGAARLPLAPDKNYAHISIQANKTEGTIAVFVDNVLAKRWKDDAPLSATGGGLLFQHEIMTGATLKLSNFKISQWSGRYEPETASVATNVDAIRFINHDQAAGKISGISNGAVSLVLGGTTLQIPLARVTQINFATNTVAAIARGPWDVRAHFPRGGSVSFQLDKWSDKTVSGHSDVFGSLAFQPGQIRELEFNLDRPKAPPAVNDREFDGLDE